MSRDPHDRRPKYQTGDEVPTRSRFDAGVADDLMADVEKRGKFCVGPARGPRQRDRKRPPGAPPIRTRTDKISFPGSDKPIVLPKI